MRQVRGQPSFSELADTFLYSRKWKMTCKLKRKLLILDTFESDAEGGNDEDIGKTSPGEKYKDLGLTSHLYSGKQRLTVISAL